MKRRIVTLILVLAGVMMSSVQLSAQSQNNEKPPTPEELAAKEAERLETLLKLEDWQVFYVDSTLQHDYAAMMEEIQDMQKSKVDNVDLYRNVQDKWMEQIEKSYRKYFTDDQWSLYLRSGAAKAQRAREKRREKAAKARVSGKK